MFDNDGKAIYPVKVEVEVEAEPEVKKLYRVRQTKDDAKTQKGAYSNLNGAIECCQAAGDGYHVFDWDYNIVYSYYLRGRINDINLNGTLFIYNRKNPAENYTYTAPKDETGQTKNNPLRQILDKYYTRLAKDHKIFLPRYSGWGAIKESYYLKGAEAWEEWLLKNSDALKMKNNKDLIGEVKQLKEELIPLPTIPLESFSYFNNKKK